ncbi:hypothetical protein B0H17DRAFT_1024399 [Mycena rosella]|uniref:UBC core domain-containing protein n=1 Tax=Mycena rosella TaxID=1033263 RepID=A0AAD7BPM0_MYCRO|nr:hypothetical protein B0H17DRAFT_1024399 [Mycena rosella]
MSTCRRLAGVHRPAVLCFDLFSSISYLPHSIPSPSTTLIHCSDTSEYPKHHGLLTFTDDTDLPERVTIALSALQDGPARPVAETLEALLNTLSGGKPAPKKEAKSLAATAAKGKSFASAATASDEDEDDEGRFLFAHLPAHGVPRDFIEAVGSEYRPGLIPFTPTNGGFDGASDFALSVSLPTVRLTQTIPAQALVAWDRRLLGAPRARHLVLLISGLATAYPPLTPAGDYARQGMRLRFQVGVCGRYKPDRAAAVEAGRTFGLVGKDAEDEMREAKERERRAREAAMLEWEGGEDSFDGFDAGDATAPEEEDAGAEDDGGFERFSLSSSLETLLDAQLVKLIWVRRTYGVGWAGAEVMYMHVEREQRSYDDVWAEYRAQIKKADKDEVAIARLGTLPHDPLRELPKEEDINFPYTAFCYLIRRLTLCTRYCLVCHNRIDSEFEALKPYVCESSLCMYQYYKHNRGASLEYEIMHNPETVDLLVSLTYCSAAEGAIDQPLPVGMALRVPPPDKARITVTQPTPYQVHTNPIPAPATAPPLPTSYQTGTDGLVDFDTLPIEHMRASIAGLIDTLPSIDDMKRHLERKVKPGKSKPRLTDMEDGKVLPAAWFVLRWCVASCTAYLEEMSSSDEQCIQGVDAAWRQFRFSVGAPNAEAKFQKAVKVATETDINAKKYPSLYAFHGSALKNWHSIIRHGLWFKNVVNGRAFGDGVYLAKEAQTSMGHYAVGGRACWRKSKLGPTSCVALAEVVNLPGQFVSSHPHFVIKDTEWIMCRYLLVKGLEVPAQDPTAAKKKKKAAIPFVKLDPAQTITLQNKQLQVPQPGYQIDELVHLREAELVDEDHDATDAYIFEHTDRKAPADPEVIVVTDDDEPMPPPPPPKGKGKGKGKGSSFVSAVSSALKGKGSSGGSGSGSSSVAPKGPPKDDWKHDDVYVRRTLELLMPPPLESSPSATMAVQRELKAMLKEQDKAMVSAGGLKELGWYMPPETVGDNLFQWIVEMHSFEAELPIAQDLKREGVNSLIFEIRFPPTYPIGPPFFRIITPRFLPFIHGGGGHVTGGGSICMDLLTSDGWLPSYRCAPVASPRPASDLCSSISAVLMQIRLAISNLDPRPARLAQNWNTPYAVGEALVGFKRAAATHGWTVPDGIDKLVR